MKTVVWDIDGTLLVNPLPAPDWDNPQAVHPTTGENVCGDMPVYFSHNQLNPQLRPKDLPEIDWVLTGRPRYRRLMTFDELGKYHINPLTLTLFPSEWQYTHKKCMEWKADVLAVSFAADYYVDNDPQVAAEIIPLLKERKSHCQVITVSQWQQMFDDGVI